MRLMMADVRDVFRRIPRRYHYYPFIIVIACALLTFLYLPKVLYVAQPTTPVTSSIIEEDEGFDLFDDRGLSLDCPSEINFNIKNRQNLVVMLGKSLVPFLWVNFRALLCTGADVYLMLDEEFILDSPSRVDDRLPFAARSNRSYTHRFLFVSNESLQKYGVSYMKKLPSIQYTAWDRAVVWLYQRARLTTVWVVEEDVQWFDVHNMNRFFDIFASDDTDLLCANIVVTNSSWNHWPRTKSDIFPQAYWTGTFSPFVRWSRRLLAHHYRYTELMHVRRLKYEIDLDFRFQEFIFSTIAKIENLTMAMYSKQCNFIQIGLGNMNTKTILGNLRQGKYILHPIKQDSILTKCRLKEIATMLRSETSNHTCFSETIIKQ